MKTTTTNNNIGDAGENKDREDKLKLAFEALNEALENYKKSSEKKDEKYQEILNRLKESKNK